MSIKHVIFTSQQSACNRHGWDNWAVISITDSGIHEAKLLDGWFAIHRTAFDDIDHHDGEYVLFNAFHALSIIQFLERCNEEKIEGILVHCKAGISRSAAVAKWIAEQHGLTFPQGYDQYNKHVYATLKEEYLLKITGIREDIP